MKLDAQLIARVEVQCCSLVTCALDGNVYEGVVFIVFTSNSY